MTVFGFADAIRVPVDKRGLAIFSIELAAFTQVEPATEPVMPPAAEEVIVPLFVTVIAPLIAIVPEKVRLAVERIDFAPVLIVNVAVFVMEPVPSTFVPLPLSVTAPVPLRVPFTTKLPTTPRANVDMLIVPDITVRSPFTVVAAPSVAVWVDLLMVR